jgi:hypothetical protein
MIALVLAGIATVEAADVTSVIAKAPCVSSSESSASVRVAEVPGLVITTPLKSAASIVCAPRSTSLSASE